MTFRPRVSAGVPEGGRFTAKAHRESPVSLAEVRRHDNALLANLTSGSMDPVRRRQLARKAVMEAINDGTAARLVGISRLDDVATLRDAAAKDWMIDRAVDGLSEKTRSGEGRVPANALGMQLCKQILLAERGQQRTVS